MSLSPLEARPLFVFLVENHADTRKYLTLYLQQIGHTVFSAGSMAEAIATVSAANCDVLISDIGLPDGDGWELLRLLQESGRPFPGYAIAMSGFGMTADRAKSVAAGFRHHLLKPFVPDELDALLAEAALEPTPPDREDGVNPKR